MSELAVRCPDCGAALVERTQHATGKPFLGCSRWPDCRHTQPLPAYLEMQRAGARPLFDDEVSHG
jgi:ssDNA-binding Zn-finger/Zn-ribbon topoisomerase 1